MSDETGREEDELIEAELVGQPTIAEFFRHDGSAPLERRRIG